MKDRDMDEGSSESDEGLMTKKQKVNAEKVNCKRMIAVVTQFNQTICDYLLCSPVLDCLLCPFRWRRNENFCNLWRWILGKFSRNPLLPSSPGGVRELVLVYLWFKFRWTRCRPYQVARGYGDEVQSSQVKHCLEEERGRKWKDRRRVEIIMR